MKDSADKTFKRLVKRAVGDELRHTRERLGLTRADFVTRLPSGIGDRTVLSYEHALRDISVTRFIELCFALGVDPTALLTTAVQRARLRQRTIALRVDLHQLLADEADPFFLHGWAKRKLSSAPDGVATITPELIDELADFLACSSRGLSSYLAEFLPELVPEQE